MRLLHPRAALLVGASALVIGTLAACVGEDPAPVTSDDDEDAGAGTDSGNQPGRDDASPGNDGGTESAWIGWWSINDFATTDSPSTCREKIKVAAEGMGGGYVATSSQFAAYADRGGALVVATCVTEVGKVLFQAWAMDGAANPENDEKRLRVLWQGGAPPAVSASKAGLPKITARERLHDLGTPTPASTCQARAKKALASLAVDSAPLKQNRWNHLIGEFAAAVGADGSTASISCLGDTGRAVLDFFTTDADVDPDAVLNALVAEFESAE